MTYERKPGAAPSGTSGLPKPTLVEFGDSILSADSTTTFGGVTSVNIKGIMNWAQVFLRQRFNILANAGVGGNTTAQMLARITSDVLSLAPGYVLFLGGVNDIQGGVASSTTIANLTAIFDAIRGARSTLIVGTVLPSQFIDTTAEKQALSVINRFIVNYARANNDVILVDWHTHMVNPSTGDPLANSTADGTHPAALGASILGRALAAVLDPIVPHVDSIAYSNVEPYNGHPNAMMVGNNGSGLPTGSIPLTDGTAPTYTATKVARTDNVQGEWAQIALTAGGLKIAMDQLLSATPFAIGDSIYFEQEFETDAAGWATIQWVRIALEFRNGGGGISSTTSILNNSTTDLPIRPASGILRTPAVAIPATTITLRTTFHLATPSGVGGGTIRWGRAAVRLAGA